MSFGVGLGDLILVLNLCHSVCKTLRNAPSEYRECKSELQSVTTAVESLVESAQDPQSSLSRHDTNKKRNLVKVINGLQEPLKELQDLVEIHSAIEDDGRGRAIRLWKTIRFGLQDIDNQKDALNFHLLSINLFLTSLDGFSMGRVEQKLDKIYAMLKHNAVGNSLDLQSCEVSFMSTRSSVILSEIETGGEDAWEGIKEALVGEKISLEQIQAHRNEIFQYCRSLLAKDPPSEASLALSGLVRPIADHKTPQMSTTTTLIDTPPRSPLDEERSQGGSLSLEKLRTPSYRDRSGSSQVHMSEAEARQIAGYEAAADRASSSIHQSSPREEDPPVFRDHVFSNESDPLIEPMLHPADRIPSINSNLSSPRANSAISRPSLSSTVSAPPTSVAASRTSAFTAPSLISTASTLVSKPSNPRSNSSQTEPAEKSAKKKSGRKLSGLAKSFKASMAGESAGGIYDNPFKGYAF